MPFDEEEQTPVPSTDPSTAPPTEPSYDSAALSRDRLTRELVLAVVHGRVFNLLDMKEIVDNCRATARYIQSTNEVKDYYI